MDYPWGDQGPKDGEEIGLTSGGFDTLVSVFLGDADPSTVTNPNATDSDQDGISDGKEDLNHNGRVDSGEANPTLWDTDRDGLPDGRVNFTGTWKGEDLNNNGIRDKDANDEWNETDFLANDSDVDGVFDGAEKNGSYCFKNATSTTCTNPALDPLNADFDGDGLRDGQELAGWIVGVWYERTMEKKENRSVTSYPWLVNSDSDTLTDFNEFMNGSDPTALDTDGDGLNDSVEIALKSNITGIEGTPPQIENVSLQIGIEGVGVGLLYLPTGVHVTVSFDVRDNVGLGRLDVRFMRFGSSVTDHLEWARADAPTSYHYSHDFQFGILDALVSGADVNITAYDANENGAWTQFHIQSVLEAVVAAIAAFLSAIAKVIVEAVSAALSWIAGAIHSLLQAAIDPIMSAIVSFITAILRGYLDFMTGIILLDAELFVRGFSAMIDAVFGDFFAAILVVSIVVQAASLILMTVTGGLGVIVNPLFRMLIGTVTGLLIGTLVTQLLGATGIMDSIKDFSGALLRDALGSVFGNPGASRGICEMAGSLTQIAFTTISTLAIGLLITKKDNAKTWADGRGKEFKIYVQRLSHAIAEVRSEGAGMLSEDVIPFMIDRYLFDHGETTSKKARVDYNERKDMMDVVYMLVLAILMSVVGALASLVIALSFGSLSKAERVALAGVPLLFGTLSFLLDRKAKASWVNKGSQGPAFESVFYEQVVLDKIFLISHDVTIASFAVGFVAFGVGVWSGLSGPGCT